jgi:hypothetical protein
MDETLCGTNVTLPVRQSPLLLTGQNAIGLSLAHRNPLTAFFHAGRYLWLQSQVPWGPHSIFQPFSSLSVHSQTLPRFGKSCAWQALLHSSWLGRRFPRHAQ